GERGDGRRAQTSQPDEDEDIQMTAEEMDAMDQMEESSLPMNVRVHAGPARATPVPSSSRATTAALGGESPPAPIPQRRRMVITHDRYITLQSLIVMHLT